MPRQYLRIALIALAASLLAAAPARAQGVPSAVLADYQAKLAQYLDARQAYDAEAEVYWNAVSEKRRLRNAKRRDHLPIALADYVLTQPPRYAGPPRPVDPLAPGPQPSERPPIPVVADFLQAAAEQYRFVPQRPASDLEFKRVYARTARAAGLTREQIVGVYAFETGGRGSYDTQAGLEPPGPGKHAVSPAIGYNQLLSTNSVSLLAEHGGRLLALLRQKANTLTGAARVTLERKIEALKRMIAFSRSVPDRWSEHDRLAKTTMGGLGIHAAILDIDIGPLLQVQKLLELGAFRACQRLHGAAHRRRTGIDEPDRRRQRLRHGVHAAVLARARADREFLSAVGLRAQSGGAAHRRGGRADRRDPESHRPRRQLARRARSGGGVLMPSVRTSRSLSSPGLFRCPRLG